MNFILFNLNLNLSYLCDKFYDMHSYVPLSTFFRSIWFYKGRERENILITNMFGSRYERDMERRHFNYKYIWFTRGIEVF